MRVLVACEFSQTVMEAFLKKGCDAWSCDLEETIGLYPERHIMADAREVILYESWDLIIAHPPCTYLSNAGACRLKEANRSEKREAAREFFMFFYNLPGNVCIENPMPLGCANLPKQSFVVQPYEFGDPWSKRTYLWLKNLPPFLPTDIVKPEFSLCYKYKDAKRRSIFSPGIAKAMAEAWSEL